MKTILFFFCHEALRCLLFFFFTAIKYTFRKTAFATLFMNNIAILLPKGKTNIFVFYAVPQVE